MDSLKSILPDEISTLIDWTRDIREIIVDADRPLEVNYVDKRERLNHIVDQGEVSTIDNKIGGYDRDNRAGLDRTLHRIAAVKDKNHHVIGMTIRVGVPRPGCIQSIEEVVMGDASVMLLGSPGVGKTTKLREIARRLSEDKSVIIVDTNNEIGGLGKPHPAIGQSRRLQVPDDRRQVDVMIEAVENHAPQVVIVDEISTQEEAIACQTIAHRGVQLIATAHGNTLQDVIDNPWLVDLVGGVGVHTVSDETMKANGGKKSIRRRKLDCAFDALIEIRSFDTVAIYPNLEAAVDAVHSDGVVLPNIVRERTDGPPVEVQQALIREQKLLITEEEAFGEPEPRKVDKKNYRKFKKRR